MTDKEAIKNLESNLFGSPFFWEAKEVAIAALKERDKQRDELSKGCEYCKRERKPIDWEFCPKCGRKLKGEPDE